MAKDGSLTDFADRAGISIGYASQLVDDDPAKRRIPTVKMALVIYRRTGRLFGLLEGANIREANTVLRMAERTGLLPPDEEPRLPIEDEEPEPELAAA